MKVSRSFIIRCVAIGTLFLFATTSVPLSHSEGSQMPEAKPETFEQSLDNLEVAVTKYIKNEKVKDSVRITPTIRKSK